ncbi:TPA: LysR family transcriptional regulator [Enterobacter kobei]|uniref:LysR family transcriptional regulator n=1 Tax=Enterobacter cloacae complex TaxID=354276 RepID=UPI000535E4CE|nr:MULTISPECIES: LysR family transcriptional regulator [Enterobacter cloacae complex]AIX55821.1 transcriptional regulator [Enterobacter cloacae]ELE9018116.1 LysR family transcriptional regulator [Enterobacter kobei]ELE9036275.1 LysR family transcriptional regulator [Enterobacter kobei]ELN9395098.1 LysR family transcriptional regulator [Enterobacter kobei]ELQ8034697.1 LysR family transcriptional regulator [Enterobacter kobei]
MELRYLRYFVAVARERHFTKAAKALGISQPPLSQQIKRLEEEVGTPLFRRLTRGVELTEAGEAFYEDACKILALSGSLSIGITSSDAFHPQIFALIRQFQVQNMAVQVHQVEANMSSLTTMLADGELDIAFVRLPCESSKMFEIKILDREPMVVALHRDHPLAESDSLALEQLRDTPVVLFPQEVAPGLYDRVYSYCERAGIDVQHALQASQLSSSLSMVSAGGGFALVPKSMAAISPPNVTYHALNSPELYTDIALCWRRFERSRTVKRFLTMMSEG